MGTATRARTAKKSQLAEEEDKGEGKGTPERSITDELVAAQRAQGDDIAMLSQKASAAEERAFHLAARVQDLQELRQQSGTATGRPEAETTSGWSIPRAQSMVSEMDDARSEVSSIASATTFGYPRPWVEIARAKASNRN